MHFSQEIPKTEVTKEKNKTEQIQQEFAAFKLSKGKESNAL